MRCMLARPRARMAGAWGLVAHSLSGRLLLLTLLYVLISEALISVPSIARYHRSLLESHIESAEIAILPFTELGGQQLSAALRAQLLQRAGATAVMLKRPDQRELFLVHGMPQRIDHTIDLRQSGIVGDLYQALDCLIAGGTRMLHVIARTQISRAETIEVLVDEAPIREALLVYAERTFLFGLLISVIAAILVFLSLYFVLVRPMRRITQAMVSFRDNPEDASRIVVPSNRRDEVGIAERELAEMQRDLNASLQQKTRLAALGAAVARIQHDLRNILASAQLASDRLSAINDPVVQRLAPRLITALDRAVGLATNTLRYGRADERPAVRRKVLLAPIVDEAAEAALAIRGGAGRKVRLHNEVSQTCQAYADPEHLHRIVLNLLRNAAQALQTQDDGAITVSTDESAGRLVITIADNGPGIMPELQDRLFKPFAAGARNGGSGLGLAIARDLARAQGGDVSLVATGTAGTVFRIELPCRAEGV